MSSVVLSGDTSGAITLAAPAVSGTNTATLPAATGTVMVSGNQPAFSAYQSSAQTLSSSTLTKIQFQTITFDTANKFTSNTTYTPNVAGYYEVYGQVGVGVSSTYIQTSIYKNGNEVSRGYTPAGNIVPSSSLIYMNGTTDYVELYAIFGVGQTTFNNLAGTYFQAVMVRSV